MTNEKILIVDDEEDILELIQYNLEKDGFQVKCDTTGEGALKTVRNWFPDLIVLDLMLPGIDGLSVAGTLKEDAQYEGIPIIMLTAKGSEADVVTGLNIGADDYVTKPFSPKVLVARIRAVLRRQGTADAHFDDDDSDIIRIHELIIHPGRRNVMAGGIAFDLTFTEFQILYYLAKRPGWVSTRSQIVDAVRGEGYPVTDRSVDVQIAGLRKKLGDFGKYIRTVRGVGYKIEEKP